MAPRHTGSSASGPPSRSTSAMNASPWAYWLIFASRPRSSLEQLGGRGGVGPPLAEDPAKRWALGIRSAPARSMVTSPWPSSRLISPPIWSSTSRWAGLASSATSPPSSSGLRPWRRSSSTRVERVEEPLRIGVDRLERLLDEPEVVLAQPRHAGELRPVGDLVEREPEPELLGREARSASRARARSGRRSTRGPGRRCAAAGSSTTSRSYWPSTRVDIQPSSMPDLGAGEAAGDPRGQALAHALAELVGERTQQPLEAVDVGVHPAGAVGDAGPGRAGEAPQPGGLRRRAPRPRRWPRRSPPGASPPGRRRRTARARRPGPRPARPAPSRPDRRSPRQSSRPYRGDCVLRRKATVNPMVMRQDGHEDEHADPVVPDGRREHGGDRRPPVAPAPNQLVRFVLRGPLRCEPAAPGAPRRGSAAARTCGARRRSRRARRTGRTRRGGRRSGRACCRSISPERRW